MDENGRAAAATKSDYFGLSQSSFYLLAFLVVYACLFKFRNPLQFYVKFGTYALIVMIMAIVMAPVTALKPCNPENIHLVSKILNVIFKIFNIRIEVENESYFKSDQPYIVLMNHQSSLDFLTMMKIWPGGNCTPLAKKELFYAGPFGFTIWLCGITFIDRLNAEKARGTIDALAEKINKENLRVWIFPEGTRSPTPQLLPFKKGAFHLAIQAQVPIVCVVTSSYLNFYNKRERKFVDGGLVRVKVLPPVQTKGLTADSVSNLTTHVQSLMQRELDALNRSIGLDPKYNCEHHHNHRRQEGASTNAPLINGENISTSSHCHYDDKKSN